MIADLIALFQNASTADHALALQSMLVVGSGCALIALGWFLYREEAE